MAHEQLREKIWPLAEEVCLREKCDLYDLEFAGGSQVKTVRVYIDRAEGGISVDDCANVSRGLSLLFDVEDPVPGGAYELEISSPGLERPLRLPQHFKAVLGQKIKLRSKVAIEPSGVMKNKKSKVKQIMGTLKEASEENVTVETDGQQLWQVPLEDIHKANVIFEFAGNKPAKSK